jgi:hypothetical protein
MIRTHARLAIPLALLGCLPAMPAAALLPAVYSFSTGDPDGLMATASRPDSAGKFEIESADDFVLTTTTSITSATFTGLLTGDGSVSNVRVEIYRVFPNDSDEQALEMSGLIFCTGSWGARRPPRATRNHDSPGRTHLANIQRRELIMLALPPTGSEGAPAV